MGVEEEHDHAHTGESEDDFDHDEYHAKKSEASCKKNKWTFDFIYILLK